MTDRRRAGNETRTAALRVALELFSSKGYEATSLREIAERLGISKAALYYHFASKEEIVRAGMLDRGSEAADLLDWARAHADAPDLLELAVRRWVGSLSTEKLNGIRFITANPTVLRKVAGGDNDGGGIREGLEAVVSLLAGKEADPTTFVLIRMAFLTINAAVSATADTDLTDDQIINAARRASEALLTEIRSR